MARNYILGAHLSISKGFNTLQRQMDNIGADTCALFLKSQRSYNFKPIDENEVFKFKRDVKNSEILLPHGSYLLNLANTEEVLEKTLIIMKDDLVRCERLGIKLYNLHPGSDVKNLGKSVYQQVANGLNLMISETNDTIICIENMAGQGNTLCKKFEEIEQLISLVDDKNRIGVCLDTCHMFAAGYDISDFDKFETVMRKFEDSIGIKFLKALHLNDSKTCLGSNKDRHECIGEGKIGIDAFKFIMQDERFKEIPIILETPNPEIYGKEVALLRSFVS